MARLEQPVKVERRRTTIYVDARNLYMGLVRKEKNLSSWFDVEGFLLSEYSELRNLVAIKYFTSPGKDDLREPLEAYHEAIKVFRHGTTKLQLFFGKIVDGEKLNCGIDHCPHKGYTADTTKGLGYKEKQTDVSMAVEVLADVLMPQDPIEKIILITNDSDFAPLLRKVHVLRPRVDTVVYAPVSKRNKNLAKSKHNDWVCYDLKNEADYYTSLRHWNLSSHRLPDVVIGPDGPIHKPARFI